MPQKDGKGQVLDIRKIYAKVADNCYPVSSKQLQEWIKNVGGRDYYFSDWIVTLAPAKQNTPTPPTPPTPPEPDPEPTPPTVDGRFSYIKVVDNSVDAIDKRQFMRFNVYDNNQPIMMESSANGINALLDISRGGIAVKANDNLQVGDVVPVHIVYGDIDIQADVKIVSKQNDRAGAQFVNLDKATANQLLYLSLLLEETPNISFRGE
jgi:hypothetical protein